MISKHCGGKLAEWQGDIRGKSQHVTFVQQVITFIGFKISIELLNQRARNKIIANVPKQERTKQNQ